MNIYNLFFFFWLISSYKHLFSMKWADMQLHLSDTVSEYVPDCLLSYECSQLFTDSQLFGQLQLKVERLDQFIEVTVLKT